MKKEQPYRFETFRRDGRTIYVRFYSRASGALLATRSTGSEDMGAASAEILRLSQELDLEGLEARRKVKATAGAELEDKLAAMSIAEYLTWYWSEGSSHAEDMKAAKRPLSSGYLSEGALYMRLYVAPYPPFQATPLRRASFALVDRFFRAARDFPRADGKGPLSQAQLKNMKSRVRTALRWAAARGLCPPIDFSGVILPPPDARERGLLSDAEVSRILALPTQQLWRETTGEKRLRADVKPRPRQKGGATVPRDTEPIDIRMKAFVLLGPFCGFRRGEERGLRWGSVLLDAGMIVVENNYIDKDGDKEPKAQSRGKIPIAPELEVVLWELREFAKALDLDKAEDYILFNPGDRSKPISGTTLKRGWDRVMRLIGISDEERKRRNLVPHGTRHRFAVKLLEGGLTPAEAMKLTRHRTLEMFAHYSDHLSAETMERAKKVIEGRKD